MVAKDFVQGLAGNFMKTHAQLLELVKMAQQGNLNSPEVLLQLVLQLDRLNANFERVIGYSLGYATPHIRVSK